MSQQTSALANPRVRFATLASGLRIAVDRRDRGIGRAIARGAFEVAELAFACHAVREGASVVDVGAHVGLYTLHLAQAVGPLGHVYAFEPIPSQAALLHMGIVANALQTQVSVRQVAIGRAASVGTMSVGPETADLAHACLIGDASFRTPGVETMSVRIEALDDCDLRRPVAFIKLDIEGAEPQALDGARHILHDDRPVLLCELDDRLLDRVSGATPQDVFDQLTPLGYMAYAIAPDGTLGGRLREPPTSRVSTVAFVSRP
ncbi:MAG: FkbM family methyltransferase [Vicinamibacterales bacterium]